MAEPEIPIAPQTELKGSGPQEDLSHIITTAETLSGIDQKENHISDSKAASPKGKEKSPTTAAVVSRKASPTDPGSDSIDTEAVHQAQTTILAGSSEEFSDDGYNSDGASGYSTSISSSVDDYLFMNGRRYHRFREGAYHFPNDDEEQEREDMKHAMVVNLCGGKLHFAPLEDLKGGLQRVIDLGTGTGIWAIEMGDKYPGATILGIDLSPIQPTWVPPNVSFMVDDAESTWLQPPDYFDYVHSRHMAVAFKKWPKLIQQSWTHLKPGGFIEIQDFIYYPQCQDDTMPEDWPLLKFYQLCCEGLKKVGIDPFLPSHIASLLTAAGFVNVQVQIFNVPIGVWPKNRTLRSIGLYWQTCIFDFLQAASLGLLVKALGWSREEVEVFLVDVRKSMGKEGEGIHASMPLYSIYGQKPMNVN